MLFHPDPLARSHHWWRRVLCLGLPLVSDLGEQPLKKNYRPLDGGLCGPCMGRPVTSSVGLRRVVLEGEDRMAINANGRAVTQVIFFPAVFSLTFPVS